MIRPEDEQVLIQVLTEATSDAIQGFILKLSSIVEASIISIQEGYDVEEGETWHDKRSQMCDVVLNSVVQVFNNDKANLKNIMIEIIDYVNAHQTAETAKKLLNDE
jgi:hypothetical protein